MSRAAGRISPGSGDDDAVDGSLACGFVECFADLGCTICASDDANFASARIKLREGSPWYALAREQLPLDETKSARWRFAGLLAGCETAELTAPQSDGSTLLAYAVDVGDAVAVECLLDRLPRRDREETALRANRAGASAASIARECQPAIFAHFTVLGLGGAWRAPTPNTPRRRKFWNP